MTRRRKGASDSCFYYKWLDKALCDLQAARLLLTYGGDHYNIAFHCQQAIEKALKGYLLFRTGRHFDGHNLTYLCRQAIQLDSKAFSEYLDESAALNDLYIETRYPTDLPFEIDELEVRRFLSSWDSSFLLFVSLAHTRDRRPLRKGERQSGYSCVCFVKYSQFTDTLLLHISATLRRRGTR